MQQIDKYLQANQQRFEEQLKELLRIPSVSTDPQHQDDVLRAAEFVAEQFRSLGLKTEMMPTEGYPILYAEWLEAEEAPTALVYGHYDVQPPDPLDQWISPPFEPTIRDGNIYARGATDDKGQMLTHIKSAEAWLKSEGRLPLNLKFLIEGEEEIGSPHIDAFVRKHADRLACDCVVISDTSQFAPGVPAITYGLRGLLYFEAILRGPRQDLHSGGFGGAVANPANEIVRMLACLHDAHYRVEVPHFYDDVLPLEDWERRQWAKLPFDEEQYRRHLGVAELVGEEGYTTLERKWGRPTCDINGLYSGYMGAGSKTIIPAEAGAKISFRLVPQQNPERIATAFRQWIEEICPPGVELEVREYAKTPAVLVPVDSPAMQAAHQAIKLGFGTAPVLMRHGGTIPVVSTFQQVLTPHVLLLGWGLPDDNTHSPNEKFCLTDFHRGIRTSAHLWHELAQQPLSSSKAPN